MKYIKQIYKEALFNRVSGLKLWSLSDYIGAILLAKTAHCSLLGP